MTYMHPDFPFFVWDHHFGRPLGCAPVLLHQQVSCDSQFALGIDRKDFALVVRIDDLGFDMGHESPDSVDSLLDGVVGRRHG